MFSSLKELTLLLGILLSVTFCVQSYFLPRNRKTTIPEPEAVQERLDVECLKPSLDFDIHRNEPRPYRPWRSGKFFMTMGLRKMPREEWLLLDKRYFDEQKVRKNLLDTNRRGVFQTLPGSELACEEVLSEVIEFLTRRYPQWFYYSSTKSDQIHNALTGKTFRVTKPFEVHPLEVAAQLIMEDINLLIPGAGPDPEQYYLLASFSMAPAGWHLEDRIGWSLFDLHRTVPGWEEKLRGPVEGFFRRMKIDAPVERNNYFLQTTDELFVQEPFGATGSEKPKAEEIRLRYERQTFQRLPKSKAVAFLVRTYLTPLTDLRDEPESLRELLGAMKALPDDMARYKGRHIWGDVIEEYCTRVLAEEEFRIEQAKEVGAIHHATENLLEVKADTIDIQVREASPEE